MTNHGFNQHEDEQLSRVARSLHREWDTPGLWPRIADRLREDDDASPVRRTPETTRLRWRYPSSPVWRLAAAAAVGVLLVQALSRPVL